MTPDAAATVTEPIASPWALMHVLVLSAAVTAGISAWLLVDLGGWSYYRAPLEVRGYTPQHRLLRPAGRVGQSLGIAGLVMMAVPVAYAARKRWFRSPLAGSMRAWLNLHIFAGIVGPVLITFHTALKFNGVISVAYWSMIAVMLSGFVGRYLYVRIPRTIRGAELTHDAVEQRVADLKDELQAMRASGHADDEAVRKEIAQLESERALLSRRLVHLDRTKRFFSAWHVFHQPLVYLMFAIAALHVALVVYMGYSIF
jgi:hypothetical protein